jgi:hypothetical protein
LVSWTIGCTVVRQCQLPNDVPFSCIPDLSWENSTMRSGCTHQVNPCPVSIRYRNRGTSRNFRAELLLGNSVSRPKPSPNVMNSHLNMLDHRFNWLLRLSYSQIYLWEP